MFLFFIYKTFSSIVGLLLTDPKYMYCYIDDHGFSLSVRDRIISEILILLPFRTPPFNIIALPTFSLENGQRNVNF